MILMDDYTTLINESTSASPLSLGLKLQVQNKKHLVNGNQNMLPAFDRCASQLKHAVRGTIVCRI